MLRSLVIASLAGSGALLFAGCAVQDPSTADRQGAPPRRGSEPPSPQESEPAKTAAADSSTEADEQDPLPWYEIRQDAFSARVVAAVVLDQASFLQDPRSRDHLGDLETDSGGFIRGVRLGVVGTIGEERPWTYVIGGAVRAFDRGFDVEEDQGLTLFDAAVGIPLGERTRVELGRQKEPISQERLMTLIDNPLMERPMTLDSLLRARNTGASFSGTTPEGGGTWALGVFNNTWDDGIDVQDSSTTFVGRLSFVPWRSDDDERLLHVGLGLRHSLISRDTVNARATVESAAAPDFLDTGPIAANSSNTLSLELAWKNGPWWFSSEYLGTQLDSDSAGDPLLQGGHVTAAWVLSGESRRYDATRGRFLNPVPATRLQDREWGMFDTYARLSYLDFEDGGVSGGRLGQGTLGISWFLSGDTRLQIEYGHALVDNDAGNSDLGILQMRWWTKF